LRRLPVNQDDRASCRGQLAGGDQPGQASTDDDDITIHVTIFVCLAPGQHWAGQVRGQGDEGSAGRRPAGSWPCAVPIG
jgi:hypothetical protein